MMKILAYLGAKLWENHGFWIDKEHDVVQMNYDELPLLGKIGYNLMVFGLKHDKDLYRKMESLFNREGEQ